MQTNPYESAAATQLYAMADEEQSRKLREAEAADLSTRPARLAMQSIKCISEREVCALIACLTGVIERSGWSHTDFAVAATEALTDAHVLLESQAERE